MGTRSLGVQLHKVKSIESRMGSNMVVVVPNEYVLTKRLPGPDSYDDDLAKDDLTNGCTSRNKFLENLHRQLRAVSLYFGAQYGLKSVSRSQIGAPCVLATSSLRMASKFLVLHTLP